MQNHAHIDMIADRQTEEHALAFNASIASCLSITVDTCSSFWRQHCKTAGDHS